VYDNVTNQIGRRHAYACRGFERKTSTGTVLVTDWGVVMNHNDKGRTSP
jgi:hypothetical protein